MKRKDQEIIDRRKRKIRELLGPRTLPDSGAPVFAGSNIHYEMAEKSRGITYGGIGALHLMVNKIGLAKYIDKSLYLLDRHAPYHESDHVLNLAYNALLGGTCLEDIELRRNDEVYLDAIGALRIPDPTTAGDFTRRFDRWSVEVLMEAINKARRRVWSKQGKRFLKEAFIDVDGTLAGTLGECKGGMSLSYKGIWGYHPLIVSLANTKEVLYLVNRPGHVVSHEGCVPWIDRAVDLVAPRAGKVCLRGDTDYALTGEFDRWDEGGIDFVFGIDAMPNLKALADGLEEACWEPLERRADGTPKGPRRRRPARVKEEIVREKGYLNKKLQAESVAEFDYRPGKCKKGYRVVVVRKNISVEKGEDVLFDEIRYFFYITNRRGDGMEEIVALANERCDQENVIEQLKNGVNAMRMPVDNLDSNWAYMVMAALAWNLKAWYGLLAPCPAFGAEIIKMEFRSFLYAIILLPAQIVRSGHRIIYRLLGYNKWLPQFFKTWERFRGLEFT